MGTKAVIDTNVIVSAFGWGGIPREVLTLVSDGKITLILSHEQAAELRRVLSYPHLHPLVPNANEKLSWLASISNNIAAPVQEHIIVEDPDDDLILAAAIAGRADVIITGDQHLLSLGTHKDIPILTPAAFIAYWRTRTRRG